MGGKGQPLTGWLILSGVGRALCVKRNRRICGCFSDLLRTGATETVCWQEKATRGTDPPCPFLAISTEHPQILRLRCASLRMTDFVAGERGGNLLHLERLHRNRVRAVPGRQNREHRPDRRTRKRNVSRAVVDCGQPQAVGGKCQCHWSAVHLDYYAATAAPDAEKLTMVCFNCESTSSAIVITSASSRLKSTVLKLVCNVLKMLTCRMRDSSMIMGME